MYFVVCFPNKFCLTYLSALFGELVVWIGTNSYILISFSTKVRAYCGKYYQLGVSVADRCNFICNNLWRMLVHINVAFDISYLTYIDYTDSCTIFLFVQVSRNIIQPTFSQGSDCGHHSPNTYLHYYTSCLHWCGWSHIPYMKHSVCTVVMWQDLMSLTCNAFIWPCLTTVHNMFTSRHGANWAYDCAHLSAWCCFN